MIRLAAIQAAKSSYKYRVGAVITKGGRVLATGHNKVGHASHIRCYPSIHAEEHAIYSLLVHNRLRDLAGSTIFVCRIHASGKLAMSKPCKKCFDLILSVGIKRIIYTDERGETKEIRC